MNAIVDLNMNAATRTAASAMYGTADVYTDVYKPRGGAQVSISKSLTVSSQTFIGNSQRSKDILSDVGKYIKFSSF